MDTDEYGHAIETAETLENDAVEANSAADWILEYWYEAKLSPDRLIEFLMTITTLVIAKASVEGTATDNFISYAVAFTRVAKEAKRLLEPWDNPDEDTDTSRRVWRGDKGDQGRGYGDGARGAKNDDSARLIDDFLARTRNAKGGFDA